MSKKPTPPPSALYPPQLFPIKLDYLCFLSNRCHDRVVFQPIGMNHFKELKLDSMIVSEHFLKNQSAF